MINHPNRSKKAVAKIEETVTTYKGFDQKFQCRGFQFEVGKTYEQTGTIKACENGFHACEYPLNIFDYYPPNSSRFAVVQQAGEIAKHDSDTKVASAKITIEAELKLPELIARAVKWVFDHTTSSEGERSTGDQGAAMACGYAGTVMGADGNALFWCTETPSLRSRTHGLASSGKLTSSH